MDPPGLEMRYIGTAQFQVDHRPSSNLVFRLKWFGGL